MAATAARRLQRVSELSRLDASSGREQVRQLLHAGVRPSVIAAQLGISRATVSNHARRLGLPDLRYARRDWLVIQRYYNAGHGVRECLKHFRISSASWHEAVRRGDLVTRPEAMPIEQLLRGPRNRTHLKARLIAAGMLSAICAECGLAEWQGSPIALELHHRNGQGDDNRLENLVLLCPNCHSQTEGESGRKRRLARVAAV